MNKFKIKLGYLLFLISFIAHTFAYLEYRWLKQGFNLPPHWHTQFNLLLLFSLVISLILALSSYRRILLLSLRFIALLIIGYPLGNVLGIEIILLLTIILESIYYLKPGAGIAVSTAAIIISVINQKPALPWGIEQKPADLHNLLLMIFISLLILILASMIKRFSVSLQENSRDIERLNFVVEELTKINLDYQNYAKTVEYDSVENERKRVSRELHDIIGYTLTTQLMIIQAALSMKVELPPKLRELLLQAQMQTRDGLRDARSALYKLREFMPKREIGLKLILKMTRTFQQVTGVHVDIHFGNAPGTMGRDIDATIYRLIQEGMINAFRHGKATRIDIRLFYTEQQLLLISISDNGTSTKPVVEGLGLKGMRERLAAHGGELETTMVPGGFTIDANIPYKPEGGGPDEDIDSRRSAPVS